MRLGKLALLLLCPLAAHATVCPVGYNYAYSVTVSHTKVTSALTNWPVPLYFNGAESVNSTTFANLKGSGSGGKILASGNDIVFCDALSGGNLLSFERVVYDSTTGKAEFYVLLPSVSSTVDTVVYMFYGKSGDSDHSNAASTWVGYDLVCHEPDGTTLSVACTVATGATITNHGGTANSGYVAGGLGLASASSQYVDLGTPMNETAVTVETWFNATSLTSFDRIVDNLGPATNNGYALFIAATGSHTKLEMLSASGGTLHEAFSGVVTPTGAWTFMAGTADATATKLILINGTGAYVEASTSGVIGTSATSMNIGRWDGGGNYFNGALDEIRISSSVRALAWMNADYYFESNNKGNITYTLISGPSATQPTVAVIL